MVGLGHYHIPHAMSYEEEDTCMSYEEEDTCMSYAEEDTCMSYEEEDTCQVMSRLSFYHTTTDQHTACHTPENKRQCSCINALQERR